MTEMVFDKMHSQAKCGAKLSTLVGNFPTLNPAMIEYWMRANGYARGRMDYERAREKRADVWKFQTTEGVQQCEA